MDAPRVQDLGGLGSTFATHTHTHITLRVHVPNIWVLAIWVIDILVQVWVKYMIIGYLDP